MPSPHVAITHRGTLISNRINNFYNSDHPTLNRDTPIRHLTNPNQNTTSQQQQTQCTDS